MDSRNVWYFAIFAARSLVFLCSFATVGCVSQVTPLPAREPTNLSVFEAPDEERSFSPVEWKPESRLRWSDSFKERSGSQGEDELGLLSAHESRSYEMSLQAYASGDVGQALQWVRGAWVSASQRLGVSFEEDMKSGPLRKLASLYSKLLLKSGDFREGERVFGVLAAGSQEDPFPYSTLCEHHLSRASYRLAEVVARKGLSQLLSPPAEMHECLIKSLVFQDREGDALTQLKIARSSFPQDVQFVSLLADLAWKRGEKVTACELYEKAFVSDAQNALYLYNISLCYLKRGETEKARLQLESSFARLSFDPSISYLLGQVYFSEGKFGQAEKLWRDFLRQSELEDSRRRYVDLALLSLGSR